jgi:hypothetical protein
METNLLVVKATNSVGNVVEAYSYVVSIQTLQEVESFVELQEKWLEKNSTQEGLPEVRAVNFSWSGSNGEFFKKTWVPFIVKFMQTF